MRVGALVRELRSELEQLDLERQLEGKSALFELASVDIDISFVIEENSSVDGKIDLKIVSVGSAAKIAKESVQRIVVRLLAARDTDVGLSGATGTRFRRLGKDFGDGDATEPI